MSSGLVHYQAAAFLPQHKKLGLAAPRLFVETAASQSRRQVQG
jgi:hypothetical protein